MNSQMQRHDGVTSGRIRQRIYIFAGLRINDFMPFVRFACLSIHLFRRRMRNSQLQRYDRTVALRIIQRIQIISADGIFFAIIYDTVAFGRHIGIAIGSMNRQV